MKNILEERSTIARRQHEASLGTNQLEYKVSSTDFPMTNIGIVENNGTDITMSPIRLTRRHWSERALDNTECGRKETTLGKIGTAFSITWTYPINPDRKSRRDFVLLLTNYLLLFLKHLTIHFCCCNRRLTKTQTCLFSKSQDGL